MHESWISHLDAIHGAGADKDVVVAVLLVALWQRVLLDGIRHAPKVVLTRR